MLQSVEFRCISFRCLLGTIFKIFMTMKYVHVSKKSERENWKIRFTRKGGRL